MPVDPHSSRPTDLDNDSRSEKMRIGAIRRGGCLVVLMSCKEVLGEDYESMTSKR